MTSASSSSTVSSSERSPRCKVRREFWAKHLEEGRTAVSDSALPTEPLIVDPSQVVHETIDGEVIIIQLDRANYYSLAGAGAEIWRLICAGLPPATIAGRLEAAYQSDNGRIAADLEELLARLREEGLVQDAPGQPAAASPGSSSDQDISVAADGQYAAPKFEKYTDMQDFLLVDPIHDVAPEGWPTLAPGD
jgi:hypothetical protein